MNGHRLLIVAGLFYIFLALWVSVATVISIVQGGVPLGGVVFVILSSLGYYRAQGRF